MMRAALLLLTLLVPTVSGGSLDDFSVSCNRDTDTVPLESPTAACADWATPGRRFKPDSTSSAIIPYLGLLGTFVTPSCAVALTTGICNMIYADCADGKRLKICKSVCKLLEGADKCASSLPSLRGLVGAAAPDFAGALDCSATEAQFFFAEDGLETCLAPTLDATNVLKVKCRKTAAAGADLQTVDHPTQCDTTSSGGDDDSVQKPLDDTNKGGDDDDKGRDDSVSPPLDDDDDDEEPVAEFTFLLSLVLNNCPAEADVVSVLLQLLSLEDGDITVDSFDCGDFIPIAAKLKTQGLGAPAALLEASFTVEATKSVAKAARKQLMGEALDSFKMAATEELGIQSFEIKLGKLEEEETNPEGGDDAPNGDGDDAPTQKPDEGCSNGETVMCAEADPEQFAAGEAKCKKGAWNFKTCVAKCQPGNKMKCSAIDKSAFGGKDKATCKDDQTWDLSVCSAKCSFKKSVKCTSKELLKNLPASIKDNLLGGGFTGGKAKCSKGALVLDGCTTCDCDPKVKKVSCSELGGQYAGKFTSGAKVKCKKNCKASSVEKKCKE